jgi:hypothetical protein
MVQNAITHDYFLQSQHYIHVVDNAHVANR